MEQLQAQCSSFNIKQIFNRYCLLSGKEVPDVDGLTCSIPVHLSDDKILIDYSVLSKRKDVSHSLQWTHIYTPTLSHHVIGNSSACATLLQWLQCWGQGSSKRRNLQTKDNSTDPDFFPNGIHNDEEDLFPAAMLYGPHGSGKTAAVYACAKEAGFKVVLSISHGQEMMSLMSGVRDQF